LPPFQHNIQSVRFLDRLEKRGKGWNLSLQTLDGILCHDGESHIQFLAPQPGRDFQDLDNKIAAKEEDPSLDLRPMTLEGCVVRLADTVAYIGRDIEDAIILGLIQRADIPKDCSSRLGDTNGTIVYNLVTDLIMNSRTASPGGTSRTGNDFIGFSKDVSLSLEKLKKFNYERIYLNPLTKRSTPQIKDCYERLFLYYVQELRENINGFSFRIDMMADRGETHPDVLPPEVMVRDFIAGMTDDFFLKQAAGIGCAVPEKQ
jgi:dGTPase